MGRAVFVQDPGGKIAMPKIAVSYRRTDSTIASRIFRRLADHYGKEDVFIDVNDVPAGAAFPQFVDTVLSKTQVLLVLIGPNWLRKGARGLQTHQDGLSLALEYIVLPAFLMLVAHYVIVNRLDADTIYLRIASFIIPFPFGAVFFWQTRLNPFAAFAAAAVLGVIAVAGMTVSTAIRYGQPIMPSGTLEWLENVEYVVAIALGFVGGNTFARLPRISSWFPEREDWVMAEVEAGLKNAIPLLPVLVEGATMPARRELPKKIADFSYRSAMTVDSGWNFDNDMDKVIAGIDKILGGPQAATKIAPVLDHPVLDITPAQKAEPTTSENSQIPTDQNPTCRRM